MSGIDARIVIIGLPQVIHALGADAEQGIWISQAYMLGTITILLLVGRFADLFGGKRVYTSGFLIFTVGSALTSVALNPFQVIVFRIIQGMGAGVILTTSVAIITDATPRNELGYSLGINSLGLPIRCDGGFNPQRRDIDFHRRLASPILHKHTHRHHRHRVVATCHKRNPAHATRRRQNGALKRGLDWFRSLRPLNFDASFGAYFCGLRLRQPSIDRDVRGNQRRELHFLRFP